MGKNHATDTWCNFFKVLKDKLSMYAAEKVVNRQTASLVNIETTSARCIRPCKCLTEVNVVSLKIQVQGDATYYVH
jgi:hypothetical protein